MSDKPLTASKLRENIYKILDQVLDSGVPAEIERSGKRLRIVPVDSAPSEKLDCLVKRSGVFACDPEELVHVDWSDEWQP